MTTVAQTQPNRRSGLNFKSKVILEFEINIVVTSSNGLRLLLQIFTYFYTPTSVQCPFYSLPNYYSFTQNLIEFNYQNKMVKTMPVSKAKKQTVRS